MNTTIYGDESRPRMGLGHVDWSTQDASAPGREKRVGRGRRPSPQRVLVVEDEPNVALFLQAALQDLSDCEVGVAYSGERALRLLKEQPFDLLITDYKMPGMDGIVLAGQVRVFHPRTVIMIITAFADDALCRASAAVGVQQVVHKPVKSGPLRALAAEALGRGSDIEHATP